MEELKKEAINGCLSKQCIVPYLVYHQLIGQGKIQHSGFFVVKDNKIKSYGLNQNGKVMSPDTLLEGKKIDNIEIIESGKNPSLIGIYPIKNQNNFSKFMDNILNTNMDYSPVELYRGKNCATLVEEAVLVSGNYFNCKWPLIGHFWGFRLPILCSGNNLSIFKNKVN